MSALYSKACDHLPTEQDGDFSYTDPELITNWQKRKASGGIKRGKSCPDVLDFNQSEAIYDEMGQINSSVYMEFEQDSSHSHAGFNPHFRSGVDTVDGTGLRGRGPSSNEASMYCFAAEPNADLADVQRRHPQTQRSVSLDEEYSQPPDQVPHHPGSMVGSQDYQEPYRSQGLVREPVPDPGSIYLLAKDVQPPIPDDDAVLYKYNHLNELSNYLQGVTLASDTQQKNSYDHLTLWSSRTNAGTDSAQTGLAPSSRTPKTNTRGASDFIAGRVAQMEHVIKNDPQASYEEPWDTEEGRRKFESVMKKAEKTHERRVSNTSENNTTRVQKTSPKPANQAVAVSQASNANIYGHAWSSPTQKPDPVVSGSAKNVFRNPTAQQQRNPATNPPAAGAANYEDAWDLPEKQKELEEKLLKAGLRTKSLTKPDTLHRESETYQRDNIHGDIAMFSKRPSLTNAAQALVMPPAPMRRTHPPENIYRAQSCRSLAALAEKIDRDLPLEEQNFYHGTLKRTDAERMLTVFKEGSYLIRRSETNKNDYSLTLKGWRNIPMHMKITTRPDGTYVLGENSPPFDTIPLMVDYYTSHELPVQDADRICLLYPIPS